MQVNEVTISWEVASEPIFLKTNGTASVFIDLSHQVGPSEFELVKCLAVGELALNLIHLEKGESVLVKGRLRAGKDTSVRTRANSQIECSQVLKCEFISPKASGATK